MTTIFWLVFALAAGAATGLAFFGGLWTTLRRLPGAAHPGRLMAASLVVRLGLAAAVFAVLARAGGWSWAVAGLAGFVVARHLVTRRVTSPVPGPLRERTR